MQFSFAPMDGITNAATRRISYEVFEQHKKPEDKLWLWTEFMNADGFIINPSGVAQHLQTFEGELPIAQIFGGNKESLIETTKILSDKGSKSFSGINLNTGCPSTTVMKCGGGADMLKRKKETLEIIKTLSEIVHQQSNISFSIKTRLGLNEADKAEQKAFILAASHYCDHLSIHGRTLSALYRGAADFETISQLQQESNCPIIANGGIESYEDANSIAQHYQFDHLMIGQAAIGNPWIFTDYQPNFSEKKQIMLRHLELLISFEIIFETYQKKAFSAYHLDALSLEKIEETIDHIDPNKNYVSIREARKYLFRYLKGIPDSKSWKVELISKESYGELKDYLENL